MKKFGLRFALRLIMILRTKTLFFSFLALISVSSAYAIDFDSDGLEDFVLIELNLNSKLEWFAIDTNDATRRSLGEFGEAGVHLAVGEWTGSPQGSKALVRRKDSGDFEWDMDLPAGLKSLSFGKYPEMVISGFDADKNGSIDPVTVSKSGNKLTWKILANPALGNASPAQEVVFGGRNDVPFYANTDGTGDKLGTAKVSNKGDLTLRFFNTSNAQIQSTVIKGYNAKADLVLPAETSSGNDLLYVIQKQGTKVKVTVVNGGKKVKTLNVNGDEIVVGKYLGGSSEVLAVRSSSSRATIIDSRGKKSTIDIDLNAILVDKVNINTFKAPTSPVVNPPPSVPTTPPAGGGKSNPLCSGTAISTEHLLWKPVSDTSGNAVVVFDSKYAKEFTSVKIELKDGTFTDGWWKGLLLWGNPDAFGNRQHWRTNVRASQVKDNGLIIATDGSQECRFVIPGSATRRWE